MNLDRNDANKPAQALLAASAKRPVPLPQSTTSDGSCLTTHSEHAGDYPRVGVERAKLTPSLLATHFT